MGFIAARIVGRRTSGCESVDRFPVSTVQRDERGPLYHFRPIRHRSRHRPRASTDGSRTRNLNKIGVRLWTCPKGVVRRVRILLTVATRRVPARPTPNAQELDLGAIPCSLHRPVAVTEGSPIENSNKIGVRFWTDCSGRMGGNLVLDSRPRR